MTGFQLQGNAPQRYEEFVAPIMAPFVAAAVDAADLQPGATVLDVACGTGFVARAVAAAVPDATVHGVDVNEAMLAQAQQSSAAAGITWHQASVDRLPFEPETFDAVICQQGLQFFPDADAALAEMVRVTRPGGRIVATAWSPMEHAPYMVAQRAAVVEIAGDAATPSFDAAFAFSDARLLAVFTEAGLRDVTVTEIVADVVLPDVQTFAVGQFEALPWATPLLAARPDGVRAAAALMADDLEPHVGDDGAATVPFGSWLAAGTR